MMNSKNNEWNDALQACANALEEERTRLVKEMHKAEDNGNRAEKDRCIAQIAELWNIHSKLVDLVR